MNMQGEGFRPREVESESVPDMLAEYLHIQVPFAGGVYTLEEAIVFCPVDLKDMAREDSNMVAIVLLNAAGAAIKEEHLGYFQGVTEMRGEELKVTVRPEEEEYVEEETKEFDQAESDFTPQRKESVERADPLEEIVVLATEATRPDASLAEASFATQTQNRINQEDGWLKQVDLEHNYRQPDMVYREDEPPEVMPQEEPVVSSAPIAVMQKLQTPRKVTPQAKSFQEQVTIQPKKDPPKDTIIKHYSPVQQTEAIIVKKEIQAPIDQVTVGQTDHRVEPLEILNSEELNIPTNFVGEDLLIHEPETGMEPDVTDLYSEDFVQVHTETSDKEGTENVTLTEQIILYAEESEAIDEENHGEIKLLTVEIENEVQILAEMMIDPTINTEEIELTEQKLEILCATLLEYAGIEYDQRILERFVQTLICQEIEKNPSDTEEVILDKGTHEAKTFMLRDFILSIQSRLLDFRRLGRYAINSQEEVLIWGA